jgi:lysozyme|tara:strand:+ start:1032 stop:1493 length:462 start_codon:yes stop_codon:yes gene_type:complete
MNINQLREEIAVDEGVKLKSYHDHLGLKTVGIGHLCREGEPEYEEPLGTYISEERCNELFKEDIEITILECHKLYENFDDLPEEAQRIIANMMFNMGRPRLSKFKGMKAGVDDEDWNRAADEMVDSRWYKQVPNRAKRLVERMREIATSIDES